MRIVMLSPKLGDAFGQERVMRDSSALLRAAGHEVHLIGAHTVGALPECDGVSVLPEIDGLNVIASPARVRRAAEKLLAEVAKAKADVVHLIDQFDFRLMRALTREWPVVFTAHTVAPTCPNSTRQIPEGTCEKRSGFSCLWNHRQYGCLSFLKTDVHRALAIEEYSLRRRALEKASAVLAISEYVETCLRRDGWAPEKIHRVYNPVAAPKSVTRLSDAPENLIVCAARLVPHKGVDALLRALKTIERVPWELWICGDGFERARLEKLSADLALTSRVKFLGRLPYAETQRAMASAKLVAQSNVGPEPFGLSAAEASAMGIPVVGFAIPALTEIVVHGKSGWLAPQRDERALGEHLQSLLEDETLARRFGAAGAEIIKARFSPESHLKATLSVYESAVAAPLRVAA